MSIKLTAAELREPDVALYIPEEDWDGLPATVKNTLKHFNSVGARSKSTGKRSIKYVLPAYLARQLEQEAQR